MRMFNAGMMLDDDCLGAVVYVLGILASEQREAQRAAARSDGNYKQVDTLKAIADATYQAWEELISIQMQRQLQDEGGEI